MTRVNSHGQPIGEPVNGWAPRPAPQHSPLAGRYVRLEPVAVEHASDLYGALASVDDDALWTYRSDHRPDDQDGMIRLVEEWAAKPDTVTFAILPTDTGSAAGVASLLRVDAPMGCLEVGAILFARSLQRTRAATEAIHLLAAHVFDDLGYRRLEWKLDSLNEPSARAAARLGFTYEGRFRNAIVYKQRNRDTTWFSMTDTDWPRVQTAHRQWLDPANFDDDGWQRTRLSDLTAH